MNCTNCGKPLNEGEAFCGNCGTAVNSGYVADAYIPVIGDDEETMPMIPPIAEMPSTEFCLKCGRVLTRGQKCSCVADAYKNDHTKTEKTRIDSSYMGYSSAPLNPIYPAGPVYREEPPMVHREAPKPSPEPGPEVDGRSFFKTVNKL